MHWLDQDSIDTLGFRASAAMLFSAISGGFLDHWLTRAITSALIGLCFLLLGELLKPWINQRGQKLVERPKDDKP